DWPQTEQVLTKLVEEAGELTEARATLTEAEVKDEFGDLLFVMANLARHFDIDPEEALRSTNAKFTRRFRSIEAALAAEGRHPEDATLDEMDALWGAAKAAERGDGTAKGRAKRSEP
ncbi:MAG: MazG nucleotide pyrophosphohydrolase domain-containing protein, partial [Pseudomonadota bacterium]